MSNPVYITRTSSYLPNTAVSNDDIEQVLGRPRDQASTVRKLVLRMNGIKQRYYAVNAETGQQTHSNADMTSAAVKNLLRTNEEISEIECLSCGTSSPDQLLPSHASMVHGQLTGASCEVASLTGVCAAGIQALKYGYMSVRSGNTANAVCTGSELASMSLKAAAFENEIDARAEDLEKKPILAFEKDFLRWMLSDGAGAFLLKNKPNETGISLKIEWIDIFSYANELQACMYAGGEKNPEGQLVGYRSMDPEIWLKNSVLALKQDVKLLNEYMVPIAMKALRKTREKHGLLTQNVDHLLIHMSSMFFHKKINDALIAEDFDIPTSKWFTNLPYVGNIGSASIYIMLDEFIKTRELKSGEKILLAVPESGRFTMCYAYLTVI